VNEPSADASELQQLLAAVAAGDRPAFARLYQRSRSHLYALLLRMLKRRDWAEEALQDCFLRVWQKSEGYAPDKGAPMTWLMSIARYRALDLLRARRPEVSDTPDDEDGPPIESADASVDLLARAQVSEELSRLERCMKGLQQEQRDGVLLSYYEGYTHRELARRMKAPLGTVKSWVRRGLQQLRDCLGAA
jgi:RNA polymerase sigma-70 factor (ECF subfamily)